jgi:hypothetical protein
MRIKHNPELAVEMKAMIDPTDLRTVRAYLRDPNSEIDSVIVVQGDHRIEEVAAVMASDDASAVMTIAAEGVIKFGVETLDQIRTEHQDCAIVLANFPDDRLCHVVYIPPFYIVKISDEERYE